MPDKIMLTKKVHLIIAVFYSAYIFLILGFILNVSTVVPYVPVGIQEGKVHLNDFDFSGFVVYAGGGAEFYFNKLLSPDELNECTPDSFCFDKTSKYTTARIRFFVLDGDYILFGKSPEYASKIYVNGELKYTFGKINEDGNVFRVSSFEIAARPVNGVIELVTQSAGVVRDDPTYSGFYLGEYKTAKYFILCDLLRQLIPTGIFISCALFYLGFFMFMPNVRANFWFSLIALILGFRTILLGSKILFVLFPGLDYNFAFLAENGTLILVSTIYVLFARALYKEIVPKIFVSVTCTVNAVLLILLLWLPIRIAAKYLVLHMVVLLIIMVVSTMCILIKIRRLDEEQIISFGGQVLFMFGSGAELIYIKSGVNLLPFINYSSSVMGMLLFVFAQMIALFLHNNREVNAAMEKERQMALEKASLERLNRSKTEFLGNMSHELKTPLTVISNVSQLAKLHTSDGYVKEKMSIAVSEVERMKNIVGQLLELARYDDAEEWRDIKPVNIRLLIYDTVSTYFQVLNEHNNELIISLPDFLPDVNADSSQIVRVLINLIHNAIRFTHKGTITVGAEYEEDADIVSVFVKDTGKGLSPEQLEHIFERFYTSENSTGTGLGLYICKRVVEAHGGVISAQNNPECGTSVNFTLLVAKA